MTWFSTALVFIVVWWLMFFISLPIGARSYHEAGAQTEKGNVESAPMKPRLFLKVLLSTAFAVMATVLIYFLIDSGALSFRP
ncbi:MAG: DUF1467 family protein [Pseudomonadota bacterium]|nr:DUF1467 family protein [Pseudomonadota bacterium]